MTYRLVIYFRGPRSLWSGKPCADEILFEQSFPWRWLARLQAKQLTKTCIPGRAGWEIYAQDGTALDQSHPEPA